MYCTWEPWDMSPRSHIAAMHSLQIMSAGSQALFSRGHTGTK
jgi:hypothetical protein